MGVDLSPLIDQSTEDQIIPYEESENPEHLTHIISPPENTHIFQPGMEAQDIVDIARATGQHVIALCGYKFVPVHDPEKYDACKSCMDIAGNIMREMGE